MPLHTDERPLEFSQILGNESTVKALETHLEKPSPNRCILFVGQAGCGKTTLAYCVANSLGVYGTTYLKELNSADFRGIDTVREIREETRHQTLGNRIRVYMFEECFAAGTKIQTPLGPIPIERIRPGDSVYSIGGVGTVKHVFANRIQLSRIIKMNFSSGESLFTTLDHEIFTQSGWIKSKRLDKKDFIFSFNSNIMHSITSQKETKSYGDMQMVQKGVPTKKGFPKNLLKNLWATPEEFRSRFGKRIYSVLRMVQKTIYRPEFQPKKILRPALCLQMEGISSGKFPLEKVGGKKKKDFRNPSIFLQGELQSSLGHKEAKISINEGKQSNQKSSSSGENQTDKKNKWNSEHLEWRTGREWETYNTTTITKYISRMAYRICCISWEKVSRVSHMLQTGFGLPIFKNRNRNRWEKPSIEKEYLRRSEEVSEISGVRLESSEIYQSGNNDQSFFGVIADKERDRGFVTFYDLEIEGPSSSYFANGIPVHNCHMWTKDAKEGMLKLLENPPKNCWFLLTTSDPQKLYSGLKDPTALKRRFTEFTVTGLKDDQISSMLTKIVRKARKRVPPDVVAQIIKDSLGSPGMALNILDKVIDLPQEDMANEAKRWAENENKLVSLAQFINKARSSKKYKWKEVATLLKELLQDGDAESLRRQLLGYFNAIALNGDESALAVMYCFNSNLYDSGAAGLTMCVHTALFAE